MFEAIAGFIGGWLVTHLYYVLSKRDQSAVYSKLGAEIRKAILDDTRTTLSIADLNTLLVSKTTDPRSTHLLPYRLCPKCGSNKLQRKTNTERRSFEGLDAGDNTFFKWEVETVSCDDCGWKESKDGEAQEVVPTADGRW